MLSEATVYCLHRLPLRAGHQQSRGPLSCRGSLPTFCLLPDAVFRRLRRRQFIMQFIVSQLGASYDSFLALSHSARAPEVTPFGVEQNTTITQRREGALLGRGA